MKIAHASALLVALTVAVHAGNAFADDEQIRSAIERYDAATGAREGDVAAALLAPDAVGFFERVRTLALTAERAALERESRITRMQVILMRALYGRGQLEKWSGRSMFAAQVDAGLVTGNFLQRITLGAPSTSGTHSRVPLLYQGQDAGLALLAERAGEEWLVNPIPLIEVSLDLLEGVPKDEDGFNALLLRIASRATGRQIDEAVWSPPRQ
jgi:hypothetical protein